MGVVPVPTVVDETHVNEAALALQVHILTVALFCVIYISLHCCSFGETYNEIIVTCVPNHLKESVLSH